MALLALWLGCGFLYQAGAAHGGFAPKDGQVWTSAIYNEACGKNWTDCAELRVCEGGKVSEIIAFNPFTYSADMLLPAIDLGQRSAWTPMWREIEMAMPGEVKVTLPAGTLRAAPGLKTFSAWPASSSSARSCQASSSAMRLVEQKRRSAPRESPLTLSLSPWESRVI